MKWTNNKKIPQNIADLIIQRQGEYKHDGDYSATEILNSPRQVHLLRRHHEEITQDVLDVFNSWLGHLIHDKVELDLPRATMEFNGRALSGVCDYYENGEIQDFKTTSVWSVIYGSNMEKWEQQLNIYKYLYETVYDWEVNKLTIVAILKDWSEMQAKRGGTYPATPVVTIPMPIWDREKVEGFINGKIDRLKATEEVPDNELPTCTLEDMWAKEIKHALMKKDRKSALKLFTEDEVNEFTNRTYAGVPIEKIDGERYWWETRGGERTRCDRYCPQNKWCTQYK